MSTLGLRFSDTDLPDIKDPTLKLIRVAKLDDANILTADMSRLQQSEVEGVRIINIHSLSNSLKPVAQPESSLRSRFNGMVKSLDKAWAT